MSQETLNPDVCPNCAENRTFETLTKCEYECGSIYNRITKQIFKSKICEMVATLKGELGELRTSLSDLKSSDEGHVRARKMDEDHIKLLLAKNKFLRDLVERAFDEGWSRCNGRMDGFMRELSDFLRTNGLEK